MKGKKNYAYKKYKQADTTNKRLKANKIIELLNLTKFTYSINY